MFSSRETIDRQACLAWWLRNRRRSRAWFDLVAPEAYYVRPIPLRHPIVFYEGHVAAFSVNVLLKLGLGRAGLDSHFERLFERGIDPPDERDASAAAPAEWPTRDAVLGYAGAAEAALESALETDDVVRAESAVLRNGLALYTILEHEAMHHETLLYMFHRLPAAQKRRPPGYRPHVGGDPPRPETVRIPRGTATLGAHPDGIPFGWDNEFPLHVVGVPAFEIDVYNVTNCDYIEFVEAGGYAKREYWTVEDWTWLRAKRIEHPLFWTRRAGRWFWRCLFEEVPLPMAWPVYVSHAEASAYSRWKGKRLPTEAEFHRAAFGTPAGSERPHPWGDEPADASRGNFDLQSWDPVPVGSFPAGASAWGVHDLVGNGWEWTSTVFDAFSGFVPTASYPNYSADFFDGRHYVMKGASPATVREFVRRSFRNWFQGHYPYPYVTFRCAAP